MRGGRANIGELPETGLEEAPPHLTTRCLELFLFRSLPQGDVKPLAKGLLERFGGLAGVSRRAGARR